MSVKSLLQLILSIIIFFILGGIYFIYFYSGPLKDRLVLDSDVNKLENKKIEKEIISDQEVLDDTTLSNKGTITEDNEKDLKINKDENSKKELENKKTTLNKTSTDKIKNLTKEIEYITSNKEGDIFKILAKYGKTNIKNSDILDIFIQLTLAIFGFYGFIISGNATRILYSNCCLIYSIYRNSYLRLYLLSNRLAVGVGVN